MPPCTRAASCLLSHGVEPGVFLSIVAGMLLAFCMCIPAITGRPFAQVQGLVGDLVNHCLNCLCGVTLQVKGVMAQLTLALQLTEEHLDLMWAVTEKVGSLVDCLPCMQQLAPCSSSADLWHYSVIVVTVQ